MSAVTLALTIIGGFFTVTGLVGAAVANVRAAYLKTTNEVQAKRIEAQAGRIADLEAESKRHADAERECRTELAATNARLTQLEELFAKALRPKRAAASTAGARQARARRQATEEPTT